MKCNTNIKWIVVSSEIQWPPKVWRQSYRNCSILCYYNIYICIRIRQNNDVNAFYIMLNCTYIDSRHAEGIVRIYIMLDVSEILRNIICCHKINIGCKGTENNHTFSRACEKFS